MAFNNLNEIITRLKQQPVRRIAIAVADEPEVLLAARQAQDEGLTRAILTGDKSSIEKVAAEHDISLADFEIIDEKDHFKAALLCSQLIRDKKASVMVKGLIDTSKYMKAILNKEQGLLTGGLLSHITLIENDRYHKPLFITDVAINIKPTLEQKVLIIQNAVKVARMLGVTMPLVACCCGVEKVNPQAMPETADAAMLAKMSQRGQINDCVVDGPFGLDNAVNAHSAKIKKIGGEVAGNADIILCPDLLSGNFLYKSLMFLSHTRAAAIVAGAAAPIVLTSRADSHETKYMSIALGLATAIG
jgi:phosphate butyryltransferase